MAIRFSIPRPTLSPLARRRLHNFRANRRAVFSWRLLLILMGFSLAAELVANDRPIVLNLDGQLYIPVLQNYTERDLGGEFPTAADYRDPFVRQMIDQRGWAIWPVIPFRYDTIDLGLQQPVPVAPSTRHWLGTDDRGRDVVARLLYGLRLSLLFAILLTTGSVVIGVTAGLVQGYVGGMTDLLLQRFLEIWSGMPGLYLLMILASVIAPSFWWLLGFLLLFSWMGLVSLVRAETLRVRNFDYVRAAQVLGVSTPTILWRHVLPNALIATLTFLPFMLSGAMTTLTSLDFLGLGLPVGTPSLGELLAQGKGNLQAPWLGLAGFFILAITLSLLTFVGEGLRDAFDPRKG
jgi:microcin C transport system permease protein